MTNLYLDLTNRFNDGRLRAVLSGEQAVLLHNVSLFDFVGDWIVREDEEALTHILGVLASYGARYRMGAPLDLRWLSGGWSAHLEFVADGYRARTDFVTRPPRLDPDDLAALWQEQEAGGDPALPVPTIDARRLIQLKQTDREKDYPVILELARIARTPEEQILSSRSPLDLMALASAHPNEFEKLITRRPSLAAIAGGRDALQLALDRERVQLMRADEVRLDRYEVAAREWHNAWSQVKRHVEGRPLLEAHKDMVAAAEKALPFEVEEP